MSPSDDKEITRLQRQRRAQLWIIGFLVLLVLIVLIITPLSQVLTQFAFKTAQLSTSNPSAGSVLDQANVAAQKADLEVAQTQNVLNLMNAMLVVLGVAAGALGLFGFSTTSGFRDLEKEWRERLSSVGRLQSETEAKSRAIEQLQQEMEEKSKSIGDLETLVNNVARLQESVKERFDRSNTALAYLILGSQLWQRREYNEAMASYEKARHLLANNAQMNYVLGRIYQSIGRYNEAITSFSDALKARSDYPEAHKELGLTYRLLGALQEQETQRQHYFGLAQEHLQRAIELKNDYLEALGSLGGLHRRLGEYEKALDCYRQAYALDRTSAYGPGNIASLAFYLGQMEEARTYFERTARLTQERIETGQWEPYWDYYDLATAQLALATLADKPAELATAMKTYQKAIDNTPRVSVFEGVLSNLFLLQKAQHKLEGLPQAVEMIQEAQDRLRASMHIDA